MWRKHRATTCEDSAITICEGSTVITCEGCTATTCEDSTYSQHVKAAQTHMWRQQSQHVKGAQSQHMNTTQSHNMWRQHRGTTFEDSSHNMWREHSHMWRQHTVTCEGSTVSQHVRGAQCHMWRQQSHNMSRQHSHNMRRISQLQHYRGQLWVFPYNPETKYQTMEWKQVMIEAQKFCLQELRIKIMLIIFLIHLYPQKLCACSTNSEQ